MHSANVLSEFIERFGDWIVKLISLAIAVFSWIVFRLILGAVFKTKLIYELEKKILNISYKQVEQERKIMEISYNVKEIQRLLEQLLKTHPKG